MSRLASRRAVLSALVSTPAVAVPAVASSLAPTFTPATLSDLARSCIATVERLDWLDVPENSDDIPDETWDAELDSWGNVFRRAINEPSADLSDLAAKSRLMLADLDRFRTEKDYPSDDFRLMRTILREAIAMGGQA